jgi:DNA-binding response OmpR family regulator
MGELIARMKTHLAQHQAREDARITIGGFHFSNSRKTMIHIATGEMINLTEKEAAILKHLHQMSDHVVDKKTLLEQVWGYGEGITTHTLETHVYRLRQKIRAVDDAPLLLTTDGGYRLA